MKKLVYIGFAYTHHKGNHAGYHHIKEYLNYDKVIDCQKEFEFLYFDIKYASIVKRFLRRIYAVILGDGCPFALIKALAYSWFHKEDVVFHIIYGDNIYSKTFYSLRRKNHKVVSTVHQPLERYLIDNKQKKKILWPDYLIILATNELDNFKKITDKDNVKCIPHGVCTDFYAPNDKVCHNGSILMVGNWLRNFNHALKVFIKLKEEHPEITINMVGSPVRKEQFSPYVNYYSGISDDELLALYRDSSVMYLPITRFTANNALLEAGSTGCNILISTDAPDDNTYIPNEYISFCDTNVENNVNMILRSIKCASVNKKMRKFVIDNFSWKKIAGDVKHFLLSV